MLRFAFILASVFFSATLVFAGPAEEFSAANSAYSKGDFEAAYSAYETLLAAGHLNASLLYNLGNTSYRLERPGEAALWYERTLTLDPSHREARQNLRFLQRAGGFLQFDENDAGSFANTFKRDTLVRIATAAAWLAALGFAAALTLRLGGAGKTTLWIASPLLGLVAILATGGLYLKHQRRSALAERSVVTASDLKASTAPARAAGTVIDLPPGSQIARVSERGEWHYVDIPGRLRGWVPSDATAPLWPYDSALAD
jgi:tetratricopeptide (TPR) repeat protein